MTQDSWIITLSALVQAASTVVLVVLTGLYVHWTRRMSQVVLVPNVRLQGIEFDITGDDAELEGYFLQIQNLTDQRVFVQIRRVSRTPRVILRWRLEEVLEKSTIHALDGRQERTLLIQHTADLNNEDLLVTATSPTGFSLTYRWRTREVGGRVYFYEVA